MSVGEGMAFGALLRRARQCAGLSQEALADRARISVRSLSDLERGISQSARAPTAVRLADALALSGQERARFLQMASDRTWREPFVRATGALPVPLTPLLGREADLAALLPLLRVGLSQKDVAIVTLVGLGGVGKTRLALEAGRRLQPLVPHGVWFVDLAPVREPEDVLPAIARALALPARDDVSLQEAIVADLSAMRALLILDNFEHVLAAGQDVDDLRSRCPGLSLLVTSRAPLGLEREQQVAILPLETPAIDVPVVLEEVRANPAVQLFVERARDARADFVLTPANMTTVVEICQRLDGLPLAIELAAARTRLLDPREIAARLHARMLLLTGGGGDLPKRQQTLRDALDWSYRLLGADERSMFRGLGVFAGGATVEAAHAVCCCQEEMTAPWAIAERLAQWGVLRLEPSLDGEPRLTMLETMREYALDRLREAGEEPATRRNHAAYFLDFAERAEPEMASGNQASWLERLDAEQDNLRAALSWAIGAGEGAVALRLAGVLWWFWETRGLFAEGQSWLEQALSLAQCEGSLWHARALAGAGALAYRRRDLEQSERLLTRALARYWELDHPNGVSWCLAFLGLGALVRGDLDRAERYHTEALAASRRAGNRVVEAGALSNLGEVAHARGDLLGAERRYLESLHVARLAANNLIAARALTNLGVIAGGLGPADRVAAFHQEALQSYVVIGDRRGIASSWEGVAAALAMVGERESAVRLYAAASALRATIGSPVPVVEAAMHERGMEAVRYRLGDEEFEAAWKAGSRLTPSAATAEALAAFPAAIADAK